MGWQRGPPRDRLRDARNGSLTDPPPPREILFLADKREHPISLKVEFANAANSTLDCAINAGFDGSLAHRNEFLRNASQWIVALRITGKSSSLRLLSTMPIPRPQLPRKSAPRPKQSSPDLTLLTR